MHYLAVIGDVVASRRLTERRKFQRRLESALHGLNQRRGRALASPYTVTLGDEFQALYRQAGYGFADAFALLAELAPERVRFSFATGEIVTPLNPKQAIGMDGPAFHRARAQLDRLKKEQRLLGLQDGEKPDLPTTAMLNILSGQVEGWKPTRLRLFAGLLVGRSVAELAAETGITTRAVNKNIRAAELDEWQMILQNIEHSLLPGPKSR
ncbi:MAG TPA: SatD family protein [Lacunisphaera sp.]|jgi:hypothetical protein|nr:SatD family protein [Lacunisphaera sp.]